MITLDGSHGEGGGQILRTALALSILTQKSFKIINIRKNRPTPGLKASHLAGINALLELSKSEVECAEIGSKSLTFIPKPIDKFRCEIDIKTAGSITLVMQSILLPLAFAKKESRIKIIGGTDVSWSPQIDYFTNVVIPQFERVAKIKVKLEKRGYYPKGRGIIELSVKPKYEISSSEEIKSFQNNIKEKKTDFNLISQGILLFVKGTSHASKDLMNSHVAERQERAAKQSLSNLNVPIVIRTDYSETESMGSGVALYASFSNTDEVSQTNPVILGVDSLGEKNKSSEKVGEEAANKLLNEINSNAPTDSNLADSLIPLIGILCGSIKTSKITDHILSNVYVTEEFLDVKFNIDNETRVISCNDNNQV